MGQVGWREEGIMEKWRRDGGTSEMKHGLVGGKGKVEGKERGVRGRSLKSCK